MVCYSYIFRPGHNREITVMYFTVQLNVLMQSLLKHCRNTLLNHKRLNESERLNESSISEETRLR